MDPWILKFLAKKIVFLVLVGKKTNFSTFAAHLEKILPTLMQMGFASG